MRTLLALLMVVSVVACARDPAGPATPAPGNRPCTEIGCVDGLQIEFVVTGKWIPGRYDFEFDLDGEKVTCSGALPLKPCDAGPSLTCDPSDRLQIGESGCALPPDSQGLSDIQIKSSPRNVKLTIANDDKPLIEATMTPTYATTRPNGEGCDPVCNSASEKLPMPSI